MQAARARTHTHTHTHVCVCAARGRGKLTRGLLVFTARLQGNKTGDDAGKEESQKEEQDVGEEDEHEEERGSEQAEEEDEEEEGGDEIFISGEQASAGQPPGYLEKAPGHGHERAAVPGVVLCRGVLPCQVAGSDHASDLCVPHRMPLPKRCPSLRSCIASLPPRCAHVHTRARVRAYAHTHVYR